MHVDESRIQVIQFDQTGIRLSDHFIRKAVIRCFVQFRQLLIYFPERIGERLRQATAKEKRQQDAAQKEQQVDPQVFQERFVEMAV